MLVCWMCVLHVALTWLILVVETLWVVLLISVALVCNVLWAAMVVSWCCGGVVCVVCIELVVVGRWCGDLGWVWV